MAPYDIFEATKVHQVAVGGEGKRELTRLQWCPNGLHNAAFAAAVFAQQQGDFAKLEGLFGLKALEVADG